MKVWDPKFKTFLNRYGYMLNNNNNIIIMMFEQGDLLLLILKRRETIIFLTALNGTKLAPVSPENTLVLDRLSEEGFDL